MYFQNASELDDVACISEADEVSDVDEAANVAKKSGLKSLIHFEFCKPAKTLVEIKTTNVSAKIKKVFLLNCDNCVFKFIVTF